MRDFIKKLLVRFQKKNKVFPLINTTWRRTNDIIGHEPLFDVKCRFCGSKMVLRYSHIIMKDVWSWATSKPSNSLGFKCPKCAWYVRFYVEDEPKYLKKILDLRNGANLFYPRYKEWADEDKEIARQLQALGYWGGRDDI